MFFIDNVSKVLNTRLTPFYLYQIIFARRIPDYYYYLFDYENTFTVCNYYYS